MIPDWSRVADGEADCGVYVHFPYCLQKCPYCDFNSHAAKLGLDHTRYTEAVLRELDARLPLLQGKKLRSIFFGGGTPSMWDARSVERVIERVRAAFPGQPALEITLEANPGTVERGRLDEFKSAGINRVSMGVQALDTGLLRTLGRVHDADEALDALGVIQRVGFTSHSIDLMFGIPGQTVDAWKTALYRVIALDTPHVSAYNLIYEPGTRLHTLRTRGDVTPVEEEREAEMFGLTADALRGAGLQHYEVSNYARPGHASIHNQLYWRGCEYVGVGAGAHSYVQQRRCENVRAPDAYMADPFATTFDEPISRAQHRDERVMLGLRTARGFRAMDAHEDRVGREVARRHPTWCNYDAPYLQPTELGYLMNDALILACARLLDSMPVEALLHGENGPS